MVIAILITIMLILLFFILNKLKIKNKDIIRIILIGLILEIYIFNFNTFRLMFKNYEKKSYKPNELILTDIEYSNEENIYYINGENPRLEIKNINAEIGTIKVDIELLANEKLPYKILYTDLTSKNYRELPQKVLVDNMERSKYVTCYLSGETSDIAVWFLQDLQEGIKINNISINYKVPFHFSILRFLILTATIILIYKMITSKLFNIPYSNENYKQNIIMFSIILVFIFTIAWIGNTTKKESEIYNQLTDAIINGNVTLETEPSRRTYNFN